MRLEDRDDYVATMTALERGLCNPIEVFAMDRPTPPPPTVLAAEMSDTALWVPLLPETLAVVNAIEADGVRVGFAPHRDATGRVIGLRFNVRREHAHSPGWLEARAIVEREAASEADVAHQRAETLGAA